MDKSSKPKGFTLKLANPLTLNKILNSFGSPLRGLYEDKEIPCDYSLLFIPLLFVIKIKLSLKMKLSKTLSCNNHLSSFLTLLLKCQYLPRHGFTI